MIWISSEIPISEGRHYSHWGQQNTTQNEAKSGNVWFHESLFAHLLTTDGLGLTALALASGSSLNTLGLERVEQPAGAHVQASETHDQRENADNLFHTLTVHELQKRPKFQVGTSDSHCEEGESTDHEDIISPALVLFVRACCLSHTSHCVLGLLVQFHCDDVWRSDLLALLGLARSGRLTVGGVTLAVGGAVLTLLLEAGAGVEEGAQQLISTGSTNHSHKDVTDGFVVIQELEGGTEGDGTVHHDSQHRNTSGDKGPLGVAVKGILSALCLSESGHGCVLLL